MAENKWVSLGEMNPCKWSYGPHFEGASLVSNAICLKTGSLRSPQASWWFVKIMFCSKIHYKTYTYIYIFKYYILYHISTSAFMDVCFKPQTMTLQENFALHLAIHFRNVQPFLEIIKFLGMKNSYKQKTGTTKSAHACIGCTPPKFNIAQMMVGKWVSFWDCLCLKAMLNFRGVCKNPDSRPNLTNTGGVFWPKTAGDRPEFFEKSRIFSSPVLTANLFGNLGWRKSFIHISTGKAGNSENSRKHNVSRKPPPYNQVDHYTLLQFFQSMGP